VSLNNQERAAKVKETHSTISIHQNLSSGHETKHLSLGIIASQNSVFVHFLNVVITLQITICFKNQLRERDRNTTKMYIFPFLP
jgi:hypothetical protein